MKASEKIQKINAFVEKCIDEVKGANTEDLEKLQKEFPKKRTQLNASVLSCVLGTDAFDRYICVFRNLPTEEEVMELAEIVEKFKAKVACAFIDDSPEMVNTDSMKFPEFVNYCLEDPDLGAIGIMKLYKRIKTRRSWQRGIAIAIGTTLVIIGGVVFWKYSSHDEEDITDDDIVIIMNDDDGEPNVEIDDIPEGGIVG